MVKQRSVVESLSTSSASTSSDVENNSSKTNTTKATTPESASISTTKTTMKERGGGGGGSLPLHHKEQEQSNSNNDEDDDDGNQKRSRRGRRAGATRTCSNFIRNPKATCARHFALCRSHRPIFVVSLLLFAVIASCGIVLAKVFSHHQEKELKSQAMALAEESGQWFAKELDLAILPLFSMAQFATELDLFQKLPRQIGQAREPGSLPFIQDKNSAIMTLSKRNVTGVCDQPDLVARYASIAHAIKSSAGLEGVLVNLQLAPRGVICLLHPMNNTEDFDNGEFLDSSGVWGLDLLNDPKMKYHARQAMKQKNAEVSIVGPRPLAQCPECGLYFIVRLVIHLDSHVENILDVDDADLIWIDGLGYKRWGFTTALINWEELVGRSHMHEIFREKGCSFRLTRTDRAFNEELQDYEEQIVVLAESSEFGTKPNHVSTALHTTNNEWVMTVEYSNVGNENWFAIVVVISLFLAFCISFLVYLVLIQKQVHTTMLGTTMAHQAKVEVERNMTAYFAHELRNPLSAVDNALQSMPDNLPEDAVELVHGMKLCSSFMATIMNNLLDVRKIEEGKMILQSNPLSVTALLQNVRKMLLPVVRPGVELIVTCETTTTTSDQQANKTNDDWVLGDEHRLTQILNNLCSNACKYTMNGSITIYAGWQEMEEDGYGDSDETPRMLRIECRDTGPGIPKQEQGELFQRFTTRGGAPGSGLGLAIAKQMVDLMEGSIHFESDPTIRPGTTCVVLLPLPVCDENDLPVLDQQPNEVFHANNGSSSSSSSNDQDLMLPLEEPLSILIIDDIRMNRAILTRRIQKCIAPNCIVNEAATGEEALKMCCEHDENGDPPRTFDIIIVDQYMEEAGGVMVGTDVVVAMRRSKVDSVIIGNSGNDLDDKFLVAGADKFWKKPLPSNPEIIRQLRAALQQREGIACHAPLESAQSRDLEVVEV